VEGWNPAKSTMLQVFLSLLGLVLVRQPYFNEAGYEPLAGLESSKRPSALYNERTFLRSSGFLISAVESVKGNLKLAGIEGLRDEVKYLYVLPDGPRLLHAAVGKAEDILLRSKKEEKVELDGATIDVMSKGACIPLKRVLDRMRGLIDG
jgi:ubiquitin-conjugating enzyme E2 O